MFNEVRGEELKLGGAGDDGAAEDAEKIINHGWDFIKLRLSCAQCIVYYPVLRGGFAQPGNTLVPTPSHWSSVITYQGRAT